MLTLLIAKEVAMIILYLSLPAVLFTLYYRERQNQKEQKRLVESVADKLLELADDERPIMLNVSQEKLIDKTIREIERREQ